MPFNGSGVYSPVAAPDFPAISTTTIKSTQYNNQINDMAAALSNCVTRDGQSPFTADISAGLYRIKNLAAPVTAGDALSFGNVATVSSLTTTAGASVEGNASVGGTLTVLGLSSLAAASLTGALSVGGNASVTGTLGVTSTLSVTGDASFNSSGAVKVPVGNDAARPVGVAGLFRFNSGTASFEGYNGTAWGQVGGGATGGGNDKVFMENDQTVTSDYTITTGKNALSAGPVTVNTGKTVTVPNGSVWSIV